MRIALLICAALAVATAGCEAEQDAGAGGTAGNEPRSGDGGPALLDFGTATIEVGVRPDTLTECTDGDIRPCGNDVGACQSGEERCVQGLWSNTCEGGILPTDELCNLIDDDCDGFPDEGYNTGRNCKARNERNVEVDGTLQCNAETGEVICVPLDDCNVDNDSDGVTACTDCDDDDPDNTPGATERCDDRDNDCDNQVDEIFPELEMLCYVGDGACRQAGAIVCAEDGLGTTCDASALGPEGAEICGDDEDNDCDGEVDEGFPLGEPCQAGFGLCQVEGVYVCSDDRLDVQCSGEVPDPVSDELCGTEIDEDCDGEVDEGFDVGAACLEGVGTCANRGRRICTEDREGTVCDAQPFEPGIELCGDALDNDCDERVDEFPDIGTPCEAGIGECRRVGEQVCGPNGLLVCNAVAGPPSVELCDRRDNDCDTQIDELFELNVACVSGEGVCRVDGFTVCAEDARAAVCNAVPGPSSPEVCDDLDNDCDGRSDEGLNIGEACESGVGRCANPGRFVCDYGRGIAICDAEPAEGEPEQCDELDNDCDGWVDEVGIHVFDDPLNCGECGNVCPGDNPRCIDAACYQVYYVSPEGSNAGGDGTEEAPWRSITHAVAQAQGELVVIYIAPGTYDQANGAAIDNEAFPIALRDGMQLLNTDESPGRAGRVVLTTGSNTDFFTINDAQLHSTRLEGMTFVGGRTALRASASRVYMADIIVRDAASQGSAVVNIGGLSELEIERLEVRDTTSRSLCSLWAQNAHLVVRRGSFIGNGTRNGDSQICFLADSSGSVENVEFVDLEGRGVTALNVAEPIEVLHSTFVDLTGYGIYLDAANGLFGNNLFAYLSLQGVNTEDTVDLEGFDLRNNLFWRTGNGAWRVEGVGVVDLEAREESSGNIEADPLIVSRVNRIARLREGSPAIDAGDAEIALDEDLLGSLRDARPDIGAYEYRE